MEVVTLTFDLIAQEMPKNDVVITGFGAFGVIEKSKRTNARNPKTGKAVIIPKRNAVTFRPSTKIKNNLK